MTVWGHRTTRVPPSEDGDALMIASLRGYAGVETMVGLMELEYQRMFLMVMTMMLWRMVVMRTMTPLMLSKR